MKPIKVIKGELPKRKEVCFCMEGHCSCVEYNKCHWLFGHNWSNWEQYTCSMIDRFGRKSIQDFQKRQCKDCKKVQEEMI